MNEGGPEPCLVRLGVWDVMICVVIKTTNILNTVGIATREAIPTNWGLLLTHLPIVDN